MTQHQAALVTNRRGTGCPFAPDTELAAIRDDTTALPAVRMALNGQDPFDARVVTRYADVRRVLGDQRFAMGFAFDPEQPRTLGNQPGFLLNHNGPEHARLRRMLTGAFTVRRIGKLRPRIEEVVTGRLDAMAAATGPVDLMTEYALPVPSLVICELLGVPYADRDDFQRRTEVLLAGATSLEEHLATVAGLNDYMATIVTARRADPGDTLLGDLVRDHGHELSDDELVGMGNLLLIAGHETTSNMISLGALALLRSPEQLTLVRDDDSVTTSAVEELLRHLAIAAPLVREATEDVVVGATAVRADERVVVSQLAANWDPAFVGENADLDVRRKPQPHLAFGHGVHQCLGQQLARMELRIAMPALLRRFPGLRLAVPEEDLRFRVDGPVYAVRSLPVTW
ncbi:cytochrome P450 [Umezawaea sp. Da 62-37]|uniref:cytochrome P450 n=1 Tax=Umezawaea sp. Da 62-37 TaxID=3075927 RepID=UPI0028F710F0|nr:cytochrome P450 [Umezawaea sp. Da 62-37]WNV86450.1 cytochrome P450 [Umezawaea sp. Da 62-37]